MKKKTLTQQRLASYTTIGKLANQLESARRKNLMLWSEQESGICYSAELLLRTFLTHVRKGQKDI